MKSILPILILLVLASFTSNGQTARAINPSISIERIINLYPNPATSSYITVDLQKNFQVGLSVQVFSLIGKKSFERQNVPQKFNIDLTEFSRGIYFYYLMDVRGKILETGKFQVSK